MQLIKDGLLTIPLFHGTSTLFLDNILAEGLGGVSPIKQYKIKETYEKLVDKGWEYRERLPSQALVKEGNMIVNQTGVNYRYGGVYLSPSIFTATRYSLKKYGSELITKTINLYHYLKENSVPVELDNDFLSQIINSSYQPAVVVASGIPVSWLNSERSDRTLEMQLERLTSFIEKYGVEKMDIMTQQINFELPSPRIIQPDHLTVIMGEKYNQIKQKYKL